jgi:SAM-dependent methyltransferase
MEDSGEKRAGFGTRPIGPDPLGAALLDHLAGQDHGNIRAKCSVAEDDLIPPAYFFRSYEKMPEIEQLALDECQGKVLDIGAGAGCHSLYLQQKGHAVTALDISPGAVEVMRRRGLKDAHCQSIFDWKKGTYDTLLMLMNGIGLVNNLSGLARFFQHAKKLLKPKGQILLDSTDVLYAYREADGSIWLEPGQPYYGEVGYQMTYRNMVGRPFTWLYLDYWNLCQYAAREGWGYELLYEGENDHYLARLWREG